MELSVRDDPHTDKGKPDFVVFEFSVRDNLVRWVKDVYGSSEFAENEATTSASAGSDLRGPVLCVGFCRYGDWINK
jgi:hypothetical protein